MSAMQRRKGKSGELEFCKTLSVYLGESVTRELGAARDGGPDILLGEHWAIEIKRKEVEALSAWWEQACRQAAQYCRWPALAYRKNRQPWRVVVPLEVMWDEVATTLPALDLTATLSVRGFARLVGRPTPARTAVESPGRESSDQSATQP